VLQLFLTYTARLPGDLLPLGPAAAAAESFYLHVTRCLLLLLLLLLPPHASGHMFQGNSQLLLHIPCRQNSNRSISAEQRAIIRHIKIIHSSGLDKLCQLLTLLAATHSTQPPLTGNCTPACRTLPHTFLLTIALPSQIELHSAVHNAAAACADAMCVVLSQQQHKLPAATLAALLTARQGAHLTSSSTSSSYRSSSSWRKPAERRRLHTSEA
jgi:hypothetical protein